MYIEFEIVNFMMGRASSDYTTFNFLVLASRRNKWENRKISFKMYNVHVTHVHVTVTVCSYSVCMYVCRARNVPMYVCTHVHVCMAPPCMYVVHMCTYIIHVCTLYACRLFTIESKHNPPYCHSISLLLL